MSFSQPLEIFSFQLIASLTQHKAFVSIYLSKRWEHFLSRVSMSIFVYYVYICSGQGSKGHECSQKSNQYKGRAALFIIWPHQATTRIFFQFSQTRKPLVVVILVVDHSGKKSLSFVCFPALMCLLRQST